MFLLNQYEPDEDVLNPSSTLAIEAAKRGHLEALEVLEEYGALLTQTDTEGNTALHWAALRNHIDSVIFLVQHRCPINKLNNGRLTALANAAHMGHLDIVKYLHRRGSPLIQPSCRDALQMASCGVGLTLKFSPPSMFIKY